MYQIFTPGEIVYCSSFKIKSNGLVYLTNPQRYQNEKFIPDETIIVNVKEILKIKQIPEEVK
jgi:hypothetical protein